VERDKKDGFYVVTTKNTELKRRRLGVYLIVVPMVVAIIYYSFFALNRYVSTAQVVVRQVSQADAAASRSVGLTSMLGGVNPVSREETLYLREFVSSNDMLNVLEKKLKWKEHYADKWSDPLYLIFKNASQEYWLSYYQRVVQTTYDEETGLLEIEVQAFDREFAQKVLQAILDESEHFVNEASHRMAREQMRFAQSELAAARKTYEQRREDMLQFQSEHNLLNAQASADSRAQVIAQLEADITKERTSLLSMSSSLNSNTPQIRQIRSRISAMQRQLEIEKSRLVSSPEGDRLNVVASQYRNLTIDAGIAEDAYKFSVTSLETARIEASKKIRSLVTVVSPNMPDRAIYPRRIYELFTLFIGLLLLYGIVRFITATVEDHRD